jgi:hypothetical protein
VRTAVHSNAAVAAAGQVNADLDVSNYQALTLVARMDAAAAGDLVVEARPYEADGATLFDQELPIKLQQVVALTGGVSRLTKQYDVSGVQKVQIRARNAGAGGHNATVHALLA